MKNLSIRLLLLLSLNTLILVACSGNTGPGKNELDTSLAEQLPEYVEIGKLRIEASENIGDEVDPYYKLRFSGELQFQEDTYAEYLKFTQNNETFMIVEQVYSVQDSLPIFGRSEASLNRGDWELDTRIEDFSATDLGQPLTAFDQYTVGIKGTEIGEQYLAQYDTQVAPLIEAFENNIALDGEMSGEGIRDGYQPFLFWVTSFDGDSGNFRGMMSLTNLGGAFEVGGRLDGTSLNFDDFGDCNYRLQLSGDSSQLTGTTYCKSLTTNYIDDMTIMVRAIPEAQAPSENDSGFGTSKNPIVMSFVTIGDTQEIVINSQKLGAMIEEYTGLSVEVNIAANYAAVREAMGSEQVHIGWLNTFNYVLANEKFGVDAALVTERFGLTDFVSTIYINAESSIDGVTGLKGKTMCWVDPNSLSGYIMPRILLMAFGYDPDADFTNSIMAGSAYNVITQVYNGDCDAGAAFDDARSLVVEDLPDVNDKVLSFAKIPTPNDSIAFISGFPRETRAEIVAALINIASTEEGQEIVSTVYSVDGFREVEDSFYNEFRAMLDEIGIDIESLVE